MSARTDVVVVSGTGLGHHVGGAEFRFEYCDLFTFGDDRIARVGSYVVPLA